MGVMQMAGDEQAYRINAKAALEERITRRKKRVAALEILVLKIPWKELSEAEEEILWAHFILRDD